MFKKLISALLVLCLICTFLPATIASAAATNTNVYLNYVIQGSSSTAYYQNVCAKYFGSQASTQLKLNTFTDYSKTNGFWRFADVQNSTVTASSITSFGLLELNAAQGDWTAIEIFVPVAGNYDVLFTTRADITAKKGCRFTYTILPADKTVAEINDYLSTVSWDAETSTLNGADKVFAVLNCDTADYSASENITDTESNVNFPNAGKYLVVMKNVEAGTNGQKNNAIVLKQLEIKNGSSTYNSGVHPPMGYTMIDKAEFTSKDQTGTVSVSSLYKSNARAAYAAGTTTFKSSNENVVTVSGSTVTPVGNGTAEVYAVVDGYPIAGVEVSVNLPAVVAPNKDVYLKYSIQSGGAYGSDVATNFYGTTASNKIKLIEFTDWSKSGGVWRWADVQNTSNTNSNKTEGSFFELNARNGEWAALEINVPVEGEYDVVLTSRVSTSASKGCRFAYVILPASMTKAEVTAYLSTVTWDKSTGNLNGADKVFGAVNCDTFDYTASADITDTEKGVDFPEAGKYILVAKNIETGENTTSPNSIVIKSLELKNGNANKYLPYGYTKLSKTEMKATETATASVSELYKSDLKTGKYSASNVWYESSDEDVVTISGTTVRPVGEGTAEVYAIVDGYALPGVTVSVEKYEDAPKSLSLYVASGDRASVANSNITVKVGSASAVSGGSVLSVAQGTTVLAKAPETVGNYKFKHWLGTAGVESTDAEYTFKLYTNKAILAVYEAIPSADKATITFYKPNQEIVSTKVVDKGTTFGSIKPQTEPSFIGFTNFLGWYLAEDRLAEDSYVIQKDTGVVALFGGENTVGGITVNGSAVGNMAFEEEKTIVSNDANFSYWKRGDKIVSYNKSYTFYAWQPGAAFTAVCQGAVKAEPVVVLDSIGDDYMLEYEIPADCTRLEVGIMFGSNSNITVDSCYAKAVSQRTDARGFFTVSADDFACAKGYVIYRDSKGTIKVVYSK